MSMNAKQTRKLPRKAQKRVLTATIFVLIAGIFGNSSSSADQQGMSNSALVRVTTSFDAKYAAAILREVAHRLKSASVAVAATGEARSDPDFDSHQANRVAQDIDVMKADQPKTWHFVVRSVAQAHPLEIRALLDDLGMLDLDFATDAQLAPMVRAAVDGYLNGRGR